MMLRWRIFHGGCGGNLILAVSLLLMFNCFFAGERAGAVEVSGYALVELKNISLGQCKHYLAKLVATTVTQYPRTSTVLLSSEQPLELAKAKTILDLVDSPEQFLIKEILPVSAARNMPSNDQIAAKLHPSLTRGVSIGNFSDPPRKDVGIRALIDIHNGAVIAIAPVKLLERIESIVSPLAGHSGLARQNERSRAPAKRQVSGSIEPVESKFVFAESGAAKKPPKASPKTKPDNSGVKPRPNTAAAKTEPNSARLRTQGNVPAASTQPNRNANGFIEAAADPAATADPVELESIPNPDDIVNLALADFEKLTIVQFLGLVGPYLHLDFLYDPKLLTAEFAINPNGKWRGPIKVGDLYPMLEDVLKFNRLAMTRSRGNLVTIVPVAEAIEIDPPLVGTGLDTPDRGDGIVTRVFDLEHIDTASATNLLASMRLTIVPPIPKGKSLIVTGYAHRMPRIQALLDIVDEPGEVKEFRFRELRYTMAEVLAPKLEALAGHLGTISITVSQTSQSTTTIPRTTVRKPGESSTAYEARRRAEAAARARLAAARSRTSTTTPPPTPEKPTVYLDSDERTNRILMIGLSEQLDEIEELIDTLDVVQQDLRTLELYKIEHVDAEEVRSKLEELGIITPRLAASPYSSRITGAKPSTTTTGTSAAARSSISSRTQRYGEQEKAPGEEPQIVVVEQTNSLLVNATAEQHEKIASILTYLDSEMLDSDIPVQLYPLENQSPGHVAEILEKLIQETFKDKEGKIVKAVRRPDEETPVIVADPNTFSLIVYASKKNQEWIANIIESLDVRRPQVLIDVTLVEVSEADDFDYDLKMISKFPRFPADGGGDMEKLPDLFVAPEGSGFPSNRIIELGSFIGDVLGGQGFYGDSHIQAFLTIMQEKGYGRVLAKPKILVNDNELGHIDAMTTIYVARSSQAVTTSGEATLSTSFTFDEFPSGVELDITPHISKGDLLRLEINMTRSSQSPPVSSDENVPPEPKVENNIQTTVTVPDKSTIILGGIIQLDQKKQTWKVPLLGDIPIVGGLFRKIGNRSQDTRLYIFVKAEILRPDEAFAGLPDLEKISERHRMAFEEFEDKFQSHEDWPGVKPKPMEPLKVLDAE